MSDVRAVRAFLRSRGRAPVTWSDRYVTVFGLVVAALVLAHPVTSAFTSLTAAAGQTDPSQAGAGLALIALAYAGFMRLARTVGPVVLPAADAAWLVLSPLPRRPVLARTALVLVAVSVVAGAALGVALLAVLGGGGHVAVRLALALALGMSATLGGMATAVLAQAHPAWGSRFDAGLLLALVLLLVTVLVVAFVMHAPAGLAAACATACATASAVLVRQAWAALGRIPARSLLAASTRAGRVAAAATLIDPGVLSWIAEDDHWRGRVLRSRVWPRLLRARWAAPALAWSDWRRLGRRPARLCALLASTALPSLASATLASPATNGLVAALLAIGAMTAAAACTTGARRDHDDPALSRLSGVGARAALTARAVLPMLLSAAWLTLALAGLGVIGALPPGPWWSLGILCAPALAAGALRMARRRPIDHTMPVIHTPAGSIPTGPLIWAATGADVAALGCLPVLAAVPTSVSAGTPALGPLLVAQAVSGVAVLVVFLLRAAGPRGG
ncbi:hypothetical protein Pth03_81840 [Planotetraspora thailandica]|uniref:Uncharacterized protein n=1 Tax=Planotetraspora thailandica TaxID=487172 RepID=A0A8J3Y2M5_9ACTN|nr:DUF6297 family protein [Planotetraspora thailandica]GII59795.1 hypothetical protein Pth03_81840 [Planotetraspora thailandica]